MTQNSQRNLQGDDSSLVIRFIHRNRKIYLWTILVSLIAGIGISLIMKPKYFSYGVFFPVYNNSIESVVDNPIFGYDVEADRMIQMLYADEVFDSCTVKFRLYERFDIDSTDAEARDILKKEFHRQVNFSRSPYVSVIVSATTTDPEFSADIVNYIISLCDGMRNRIYKKNIETAYLNLKNEYQTKKKYVDLLTDSVAALRSQINIEVVTMLNNQVVLKSNETSNARLQTNLERIMNTYLYEQQRINDIAGRLEKAKTQYDRPTTKIFILQNAKPSYYKTSPDYLINVVITVVCGLLFVSGFVAMKEKIRSADLSH